MALSKDRQQVADVFRLAQAAYRDGRYSEARAACEQILEYDPERCDVLHLLGCSLIEEGRPAQAVRWLKKVVGSDTANADVCFHLGLAYRKSGQSDRAEHAFRRALDMRPDFPDARQALVELKFPGYHFTVLLRKLHQWLKPATYMEVGVGTGRTMALAEAETACIGIDPDARIAHALPANCNIFSQTSDSFFAQYDVREQLGRRPVDFAFIVGSQLFEAALRDFMHLEQCSKPDSVIAIHNCIPLDRLTSSRTRTTEYWSGDVWKLIPCLRKYRPDLSVITIATKPTGLGLVTGLHADNTILNDCYDQIVAEFLPLDFDDLAGHEQEWLHIVDNDVEIIRDWVKTHRLRAAS
ncbi:tetratricopeptide repeat protein [Thiogranum longum]